MTEEEPMTFMRLEEKLKDDVSGAERDAVLKKLQEAAMTIKQRMDAGVPTQEFNYLDSLYKALEVAPRVVFLAWKRYHPE